MAGFLQVLKFYAKSVLFGTILAGCGLFGVISSILLKLIGKEEYAQYVVARAFYYTFSKIMQIKVVVKNGHRLDERPAIFISNHQSALDILILGRVFGVGTTVTAKSVLKYVPFLGWFMLASGTFFLDRARGDKAKAVLDKALQNMKSRNRAIYIFAEGTRSGSEKLELLPFKKGAFHLAQQGKIPVVPLVVSNTSNIFNAKNKVFNTGEIVIDVLAPQPSTQLESKEDVDKYCTSIRLKMQSTYEKLGYSTSPIWTANKKRLTSPSKTPLVDGNDSGFVDIDVSSVKSDVESIEIIDETTPLAHSND
ncbi:1-acylglycerol-3-phosphate O-acyltransferase [Scheffersomyces spartinae]|uniref:1-acyl-sn-glycerol-3-phosphate acyltransferase n=1 Tax=Scheffersomyces spartinae TaxID=45513 RepID=A0A9P7V5D9_9ASCO|nr:1-acylglycerol-3-phosphate O-acyltransferase [Scheffersomyces spartinae]KAG7191281.1 1-acylglycerol-3-phosphate O-acyltransferase [Scheffersomyces spartinae]